VRALKERVAGGGDPIEEDRAKREAEVRARQAEAARNMPLSEAIERYLAEKATSLAHLANERIHLRRALQEIDIIDPRIDDVTKHHVRNLVERHRDRPATARQRFGALNRLYKWLVARDLVTRNPCSTIDGLPAPPRPRTWKPDARELQALWRSAEAIGGARGRYLKAMILVPLRLNEMAHLSPDEIVGGEIVLHGRRTKNGDDFSIPIPGAHRALFDPDNGARVFQLAKSGPFNSRKSLVAGIRRTSGVGRFHFHALRKLFLSELAEHDVGDPDLADALLNHRQSETRSGVRAAYMQARRRRKKVEVMETWARLVDHAVRHGRWPREIDEPSHNVVELSHGT
jgi:integrase